MHNLNNVALPDEEGRDLQIHVKLCAIRHAQTIDEIRKTNDSLKEFFKELDEKRAEKLGEYIGQSNARHSRNERVAVIAFAVVAASLWPQFWSVVAPIASAFTGFVVPAARAITGL
jgi:hypothetical protein